MAADYGDARLHHVRLLLPCSKPGGVPGAEPGGGRPQDVTRKTHLPLPPNSFPVCIFPPSPNLSAQHYSANPSANHSFSPPHPTAATSLANDSLFSLTTRHASRSARCAPRAWLHGSSSQRTCGEREWRAGGAIGTIGVDGAAEDRREDVETRGAGPGGGEGARRAPRLHMPHFCRPGCAQRWFREAALAKPCATISMAQGSGTWQNLYSHITGLWHACHFDQHNGPCEPALSLTTARSAPVIAKAPRMLHRPVATALPRSFGGKPRGPGVTREPKRSAIGA
jgi:hypothetical protein